MKINSNANIPAMQSMHFFKSSATAKELKGLLNNPDFLGGLNIEDDEFGYPMTWLAKVGPKADGGVITESANRDYMELIHAYIKAGANPNIHESTSLGNTPLIWSIANANTEGALHLIGHPDVKIEIADKCLKTPLHLAIIKGYAHKDDTPGRENAKPMGDVIDALLKRAANDAQYVINSRDISGNTPLHYAALHRDTNLIHKLLNFGADRTIRNNHGKTPIDLLDVDYNYAEYEIFKNSVVYTFKDRLEWADKSSLKVLKDILNFATDEEFSSIRTRIGSQNKSTGAVEAWLRNQVCSTPSVPHKNLPSQKSTLPEESEPRVAEFASEESQSCKAEQPQTGSSTSKNEKSPPETAILCEEAPEARKQINQQKRDELHKRRALLDKNNYKSMPGPASSAGELCVDRAALEIPHTIKESESRTLWLKRLKPQTEQDLFFKNNSKSTPASDPSVKQPCAPDVPQPATLDPDGLAELSALLPRAPTGLGQDGLAELSALLPQAPTGLGQDGLAELSALLPRAPTGLGQDGLAELSALLPQAPTVRGQDGLAMLKVHRQTARQSALLAQVSSPRAGTAASATEGTTTGTSTARPAAVSAPDVPQPATLDPDGLAELSALPPQAPTGRGQMRSGRDASSQAAEVLNPNPKDTDALAASKAQLLRGQVTPQETSPSAQALKRPPSGDTVEAPEEGGRSTVERGEPVPRLHPQDDGGDEVVWNPAAGAWCGATR